MPEQRFERALDPVLAHQQGQVAVFAAGLTEQAPVRTGPTCIYHPPDEAQKIGFAIHETPLERRAGFLECDGRPEVAEQADEERAAADGRLDHFLGAGGPRHSRRQAGSSINVMSLREAIPALAR